MNNVFVFNEGYGHRGVWHLVSSPIVEEIIPAREHEHISDVIDAHTRNCELYYGTRERYDYKVGRYITPVCTCGHTGEPTGEKNISRSYWPESVDYIVPRVACNQVSNLNAGTHWNYPAHVYNKPGIYEYHSTREPKKFLFEGEDFPPGPVCSRCKRKLDEQNTVGSTV